MKLDLEWFESMVDACLLVNSDSILDHKSLVSKIQELITNSGDLDVRDVRVLSNHLFLLAQIENQDTGKYIAVADKLSACLPNGKALVAPSSTGIWVAAIEAATKLSRVEPEAEDFPSRRHASLKELAVQAKNMIKYGVPVKIVDAEIATDDAETEKFCFQLDQDIRRYGGINLANQIFRRIFGLFDNIQERYHLHRSSAQVTPISASAELPISYLLNLAVKHTEIPTITLPNPDSFLQSIEARATALLACINVQPYSTFENMFADARSLPKMLQRIAIYDANFTLFQLRPKDAPRILRQIFDWVDPDRLRERIGYTPAEAAMVTELILTMAQKRPGVYFFTEEALEHCGIGQVAITSILRDLTHNPRPNADFLLPTQWLKVDFWLRPLLKRDASYILLNPSWCAPAFYEAFAGAIRNCEYPSDVQSEIGKATERLIHRELEGFTIIRSGTYKMSGQEGECDAFIETEKAIVFLELKAKSLTRKSREGNDAQLLIDLMNSLVASQIQLGRHELILLQNGHIDLLQSDGTQYRLELRGRQIERVSATLLDFGGFQDRITLRNVMNVLTATRYAPVNKQYDVQFKKLKSSCEELAAQITALVKLRGQQNFDPFFACWFLSVPQLLIMLDDVQDENSFVSSLWTTRHVTMGTLDFYFEYAQAKSILKNDKI